MVAMKLFIIARSNMSKNRSMTLTLAALITFASILLYIGASVVLQMNTFIDDKNKELNGSDFMTLAPDKYDKVILDTLKEMGGYDQLEEVEAMYNAATFQSITRQDKKQVMDCVFLNADVKESIARLKIIDEGEKKLSNSIILPIYLKIARGYKTGDEIAITFGGREHDYIIYGFAEDVTFALPSNMSIYKCYIFDEEFQRLQNTAGDSRFSLIKVKAAEGTDLSAFSNDFANISNEKAEESTAGIISLDYATMKTGDSIFLMILMAIIIAFSAIIILIALTVIRFAIVTHIEGNMKNIGSMEALGYTGRELVWSTVMQFELIALVSILLGLLTAFSCTGIVTNLASSSVGLRWNSGIQPAAIILDVLAIMLLVFMIAYLTASRLKKITPIMALRSGILTHNFKRNHFPLSRSSLNLNLAVGFKTLMHNMKQNITILIIAGLMSFVTVFTFAINYNFNVDNTAFIRLVGMEKSQLVVSCYADDARKLFEEIGRQEQVKKTIRESAVNMAVCYEDKETVPLVNVYSDFENLVISTIVKGRYPIHDNEIAVTGLILKQLHAEIGKVITLKSKEAEQEYIIVGVTQQINNLGKGAAVTEDGIKRINQEYTADELYVYLKDPGQANEVKQLLEDKYSDYHPIIRNFDEMFSSIQESFNQAIISLCIGCIVITLSIIALVLFLLIRLKLIKERMNLGVAKALGFTTRQLVLQLIFGFSPICILGALTGTILALFLINPIMSALLSASGIMNSYFIISPLLIVAAFLAISGFSILITAVVARSVRKITPHELFI